MHPHTVVGVFRRSEAAFAALRDLDDDGLPPHHVGLVADDPELAGEVASHSFRMYGAVGGFLLGIVVTVLYVAIGGPSFARATVAVVLGGAFVSFGLAFIGIVVGGTLVVHAPHRHEYEGVVKEGGALVTVNCSGEECTHAKHILERSSADEVVEEGVP